jgi:hypothetical protein
VRGFSPWAFFGFCVGAAIAALITLLWACTWVISSSRSCAVMGSRQADGPSHRARTGARAERRTGGPVSAELDWPPYCCHPPSPHAT